MIYPRDLFRVFWRQLNWGRLIFWHLPFWLKWGKLGTSTAAACCKAAFRFGIWLWIDGLLPLSKEGVWKKVYLSLKDWPRCQFSSCPSWSYRPCLQIRSLLDRPISDTRKVLAGESSLFKIVTKLWLYLCFETLRVQGVGLPRTEPFQSRPCNLAPVRSPGPKLLQRCVSK